MEFDKLLTCALDIGEQMLISGAEIGRVEDSIRLICTAYGCRRTDVFTITSSIVVTIQDPQGQYHTQSRRITGGKTDLYRLDKLNALSRRICAQKPQWETVQQELSAILDKPGYPFWLEMLASALIAGAFAVFFGGTLADGLVAAVLGALLHVTVGLLRLARMNQVLTNVAAAFLVSTAAITAVELGLGHPMGPFKLDDMSGIDVRYNVLKRRYEETGVKSYGYDMITELYEQGRYGKKTKHGFYDYT